jgi:hypothetical protein
MQVPFWLRQKEFLAKPRGSKKESRQKSLAVFVHLLLMMWAVCCMCSFAPVGGTWDVDTRQLMAEVVAAARLVVATTLCRNAKSIIRCGLSLSGCLLLLARLAKHVQLTAWPGNLCIRQCIGLLAL